MGFRGLRHEGGEEAQDLAGVVAAGEGGQWSVRRGEEEGGLLIPEATVDDVETADECWGDG